MVVVTSHPHPQERMKRVDMTHLQPRDAWLPPTLSVMLATYDELFRKLENEESHVAWNDPNALRQLRLTNHTLHPSSMPVCSVQQAHPPIALSGHSEQTPVNSSSFQGMDFLCFSNGQMQS